MDFEARLARWLMEKHPEDAAVGLLEMSDKDVAALLEDVQPQVAAVQLAHLGPSRAAGVVAHLEESPGSAILRHASPPLRLQILARMDEGQRQAILARLPRGMAAPVTRGVSHRLDSVGTLMLLASPAVPSHLSVSEVISELRRMPSLPGSDVYLVDPDARLRGIVKLEALLLAPANEKVSKLHKPAHGTLLADSGVKVALANPGWEHSDTLPVVDADSHLLGVIRRQTLEEHDRKLHPAEESLAGVTGSALGELFWTGVLGLVGTIGAAATGRESVKVRARSESR